LFCNVLMMHNFLSTTAMRLKKLWLGYNTGNIGSIRDSIAKDRQKQKRILWRSTFLSMDFSLSETQPAVLKVLKISW
jgi:hypothetical protein